jgi:site-specific DNA recombinase
MKAAIYARVSSDKQDVDLSISGQLRNLRDYAVRNGYEIVKEFIDEAESGRSASSRPAFNEMIALAKAKKPLFDVILVWKLSRFARSRMDSITYKALLRSRGIKVISINEPLDDTPVGQLLEGIIESVDEFYSANLGQDIRRGMRENAERGFFSGSRPPHGMKRIPVKDGNKTRWKLAPDDDNPVRVQVVRRMFDEGMQDRGCKEIAIGLNRDGYRNSNGHRWNKVTVHQVLTNEAYCGTLVWGGRPGHPSLKSGIPPVRIENAWAGIVSREVFEAVRQKMVDRRPEAVHPRTVPSFYLLSGLLYCSCGRAMIGRSAKSHQYYYYQCNRNYREGKDACKSGLIPKEKIENAVIQQVQETVLTEKNLKELVKLVNEDIKQELKLYHDQISTVDIQIDEINTRLGRLYDAIETGKLSLDELAPRIKELKLQKDQLNESRIQTEADSILQHSRVLDTNAIKEYVDDLKALLDEADNARCKTILRSFVRRIVIDAGRVTVEYKLPVPPENERKKDLVLPTVTPGGAEGTIPRTETVSCLAPSGGKP